jgi:hypothetical protein
MSGAGKGIGRGGSRAEARLAALDASIARGLADAGAGRTRPAGEVFDRIEARRQSRAIANSPTEADDQAFVDSISEFFHPEDGTSAD